MGTFALLTGCGAEDLGDSVSTERALHGAKGDAAAPNTPRSTAPGPTSVVGGNDNKVPGSILVRYRGDVGKALRGAKGDPRKALPNSVGRLHDQFKARTVRPLFSDSSIAAVRRAPQRHPHPTKGVHRLPSIEGLESFFEVQIDDSLDTEEVARQLARDPNVISAEPNRTFSASWTPNDEFFNDTQAWGLKRIQAEQAWDVADGTGVVVAVIDTGVVSNHPDLAPNVAINDGEIPGNGLDDDGNGFVDDVAGWNFVQNNNTPHDDNGHGTHVAGTIAAVANNQHGIAGVAHNARIMPLRALGTHGQGNTIGLANALAYAIANGANVINNSWGGLGSSATFDALIATARELGIVVISAVGNNNRDACGYTPANVEDGITVAATTPTDGKADYSNFGVQIDVAAPGGSGTSTSAGDVLSTFPSGVMHPAALLGGDGHSYVPLAGTSMAAPHVSGIAALILAQHPEWSPEQVRQALRMTADDVGTVGFDIHAGYGRVNAWRALSQVAGEPTSASITLPRNCSEVSGTIFVEGTSVAPQGGTGYVLEYGMGTSPTSFHVLSSGSGPVDAGLLATVDTTQIPDGTHTLRLRTLGGLASEDRNVITVRNVFLTAPLYGERIVDDTYTIRGQVAGNVQSYVVDVAPGKDATSGFQPVLQGSNPVLPTEPLGAWTLGGLPDGWHTLRLTALYSTYSSVSTISVVVDRSLVAGFPRSFEGSNFKSPKVADLDGDGLPEIVYGTTVVGHDGAVKPGWTQVAGIGRTNPAILDIDDHPDLEVIVADFDLEPTSPHGGTPVVYAYKHDKTVVWSYPILHPSETDHDSVLTAISAGDVDGDGDDEVVFAAEFLHEYPTNRCTVFVLDAKTGVEKSRFELDGVTYGSVALADIDSDGVRDLVISTQTDFDEGLVHVMRWNGEYLPGWPQQISDPPASDVQVGHLDPVVGDVDNDWSPDILVASYLFASDGSLKQAWPLPYLTYGTGLIAQLYPHDSKQLVFSSGHDVALTALDLDGTHAGSLSHRYHESAGFSVAGRLENFAKANPILADVNGDGKIDVLAIPSRGYMSSAIPVGIYAATLPSKYYFQSLKEHFIHTDSYTGAADLIRSTPIYTDLDRDGQAELIGAGAEKLYAWHLSVPYDLSPWPMFQRDLRNTGASPTYAGLVQMRWKPQHACLYSLGGAGTEVWTTMCTGYNHTMQFQLVPVGNGRYRLRNYVANTCIGGTNANGNMLFSTCSVQNPAQVFQLVPVGSSEFRLRQETSGQCLVPQTNGRVRREACSSSAADAFVFERFGENMALRATATAQSSMQGNGPARVKDGWRNSAWISSGGQPQWIQLDFGGRRPINRIDVYSATAYEQKDYEIEYYDGLSWKTLVEVTGNTEWRRQHVFEPITASRVRLIGKSGSDADPNHVRIAEIEVYRAD